MNKVTGFTLLHAIFAMRNDGLEEVAHSLGITEDEAIRLFNGKLEYVEVGEDV